MSKIETMHLGKSQDTLVILNEHKSYWW